MPPSGGEYACAYCKGPLPLQGNGCQNCQENADALDGIVIEAVPVSLYFKPSRLRDWLTFYKSSDEALADPAAGSAITELYRRYFLANQSQIAKLNVDAVVVVPSTRRPPPHPLAVLLEDTGALPARIVTALIRTSAPLGHNQPSRDAFAVVPDVAVKRVLLIDDVYTSGARAQSAAFALRSAGIEVAALWIAGRRYNREWNQESASLVERQQSAPFSWATEDRQSFIQTCNS